MLTQFTNAYLRHSGEMSSIGLLRKFTCLRLISHISNRFEILYSVLQRYILQLAWMLYKNEFWWDLNVRNVWADILYSNSSLSLTPFMHCIGGNEDRLSRDPYQLITECGDTNLSDTYHQGNIRWWCIRFVLLTWLESRWTVISS